MESKTPMEWKTPDFEEIGTSAEVTAYVFLGE
jgi:coenzyme PQQ precursor peptide PqqA